MRKIIALTLLIILCLGSCNTIRAQESTNSAESVREKVKEKIENVLNKPKAYLGTITDKTGDILQIKNLRGEIQFISVKPDNSTFISVGKTSKTIKYADIAMGDFIIAMGFVSTDNESKNNGNTVLEVKRTLITNPIEPTTRKITFGNVVKIEKKILTLNSNGQEVQFEFPKSWKGPEIDEISENDHVVIVSIPQEGKTIIRTIEIINKNETPSPTTSNEE